MFAFEFRRDETVLAAPWPMFAVDAVGKIIAARNGLRAWEETGRAGV